MEDKKYVIVNSEGHFFMGIFDDSFSWSPFPIDAKDFKNKEFAEKLSSIDPLGDATVKEAVISFV